MVLDEPLRGADRRDPRALIVSAGRTSTSTRSRAANRKQAVDPARAPRSSSRSGPRPGWSCRRPTAPARRSSCCPGRRASCSRCGAAAVATEAFRRGRSAGATELPPGDAAAVRDPRVGDRRDAAPCAEDAASTSTRSRSRPACAAARSRSSRATSRRPQAVYERFAAIVRERHADTLFSDDGRTVDQQVAALLRARRRCTIATAESCTGGLLAARLTDLAGLVGLRAGRARRLLQRGEDGAGRRRSGADRAHGRRLGRGRRGAGRRRAGGAATPTSASASPASPGRAAGRDEKPVGLVCFCVAGSGRWSPRRGR